MLIVSYKTFYAEWNSLTSEIERGLSCIYQLYDGHLKTIFPKKILSQIQPMLLYSRKAV